MKRTLWMLLAAVLATTAARAEPDALEQGFRNVPDAAKPWAYWWWLKGNVTEESIAADLEAMKRVGIGGLLMFDARGYHEGHVAPPPSRMEFMSPEWRRMLKLAIVKASQLGLEVSVNLSSCAGALKGPWAVGDDAPKKLVWTSAAVRGPQRLNLEIRRPAETRFWQVAVLAVRHAEQKDAPQPPAANLSDHWQDVAPPVDEARRGSPKSDPQNLGAALGGKPPVQEAVDVSDKIDARGRLAWDVPAGQWTLLRFACVTMPDHEYDVDILDPQAVQRHFERMAKPILDDAGPLAGKTLTHFYSVSWEGAAPTWTLRFDKEFEKQCGYRLRPWLPVLCGFTLQNRGVSERFLRDYYKTLGNCFMDNFYGTLHQLCGRAGLKWHSESGGPWDRQLAVVGQADQLAFLARNDMPQGEFWWQKSRAFNRPAAMTAHVYGKRLAATEAFTHMQPHWSAYPATLKPRADAAFCDGINHFVWHTFTASPPELGKPGSEYFAGTHLNPNVTWWPQAGPFLAYLGRTQFLLRQGRFVADVCAYVGDKPYLHWDQGKQWSQRATLTLGRGYAFDLVNTEVLLGRLSVEDGDLVLPDGMRYRLLVVDLDENIVSLPAARRIVALRKAGARILFGNRLPHRTPGLAGYPACDDEARRLWLDLVEKYEHGVDGELKAKGVLPDFEGPWDYTHRRSAEADIYFVAGKGTADCIFRVGGKEPELWDPVAGTIGPAVGWRATADGRAVVPLSLPENGAVFVVFRKPAGARRAVAVPAWEPEQVTLRGPWNVEFEPGRGAPKSAVFDALIAWDARAEAGIKFFSGAATYRKSFELTEEQSRRLVRLQLGDVKYICQVRVNGKDLGVVWTAPWAVELTGAIKTGRNELEITVVNTWVNRLIGDAGLPPDKRITKTNVALQPGKRTVKPYQGFGADDPLMPSGLLGPVRLEFGRTDTVEQ